MHDAWKVAEAVIGVSQRVLLRGKPGTGKTYAATHLALREDQEVYSVTMTEETPMAEFRGHFVQKGGDFIWMDGPGIKAWLEGARLVINEIDRASEDILSFMYVIMDDPDFARITLPDGRTVTPAEGFQLVATMNGIPEDLPEALQDRLPVSLEILEVNPKALERLPEDLRGPAENSNLTKNGGGISIRAWLEFALLRERIDIDVAAQAIFGDQAADALLAINVSNVATEPHDMTGEAITNPEHKARKTVRSWLDFFHANPAMEKSELEIVTSAIMSALDVITGVDDISVELKPSGALEVCYVLGDYHTTRYMLSTDDVEA